MKHISVCICTYKRPNLLKRLLNELDHQETEGLFDYSIVIVDNDKLKSAQDVALSFQELTKLNVKYCIEPEQNIALARNRAICNAIGNLIAFIDDDEYPAKNWLLHLYTSIKKFKVDGVLGPVLPDFPIGAPEWLKKSKFCERGRNTTGTLISIIDARTGNILIDRSIFETDDKWFDPSRGRTGGEDGEFLGRQMKKGRRFVWCDEALVFETVPEERWSPSFYLKRSLRIGTITGEKMRRGRSLGIAMKSCILFFGCVFLLPVSFLMRKHVWMRVVNKMCYEIGRLTSFIGLSLLRYRN